MDRPSSISNYRRGPVMTQRVALGAAFAALLCLTLTPAAANAQAREDGAPAEALGVGDHMRASAWGPAALYFNPAGMSLVRTLSLIHI